MPSWPMISDSLQIARTKEEKAWSFAHEIGGRRWLVFETGKARTIVHPTPKDVHTLQVTFGISGDTKKQL